MKVTRDKTEEAQAYLTIEMDSAEVDEALAAAYGRLVKKTNVPGFRKGKAPRAVLERYVGKEGLMDEALSALVPDAFERAVVETAIEPFMRPQLEVVKTEPVTVKAVVPLRPTVEPGDYKGIRVTAEKVEVADADVNAFIEQMRHEHATWEPVERPVEDSDLVVLDIDSTLEGAPFLERKQAQFRVAPGTPLPAPGFSEQLIGLERDHRKEFDVDYPADYPRPELAGKKASFKVRVGEVKKEKLPDLDDAFARSVNPEWETLARLREEVTAGLKSRAEAEARAALEERVIDEAAKRAKAEFPPVLVAIEMDRMLEQQLRRFQGGGLDEYLKAMRKTEAEMLTELRPIATQRVSRSLVLDKISQAEGITTTDAEIEAEIEGMAGGAGERKEELERLLRTEQSRETLRQSLVTRKTIQRLVEIAAGPPPEG